MRNNSLVLNENHCELMVAGYLRNRAEAVRYIFPRSLAMFFSTFLYTWYSQYKLQNFLNFQYIMFICAISCIHQAFTKMFVLREFIYFVSIIHILYNIGSLIMRKSLNMTPYLLPSWIHLLVVGPDRYLNYHKKSYSDRSAFCANHYITFS